MKVGEVSVFFYFSECQCFPVNCCHLKISMEMSSSIINKWFYLMEWWFWNEPEAKRRAGSRYSAERVAGSSLSDCVTLTKMKVRTHSAWWIALLKQLSDLRLDSAVTETAWKLPRIPSHPRITSSTGPSDWGTEAWWGGRAKKKVMQLQNK